MGASTLLDWVLQPPSEACGVCGADARMVEVGRVARVLGLKRSPLVPAAAGPGVLARRMWI